MPKSVTSRNKSWVAILAAYLLVVQTVFAGLAAGAHAHAAVFDRTLALTHCSSSGDTVPDGRQDQGHGHAGMACCTICLAFAADGPPQARFAVLSDRPADQVAFARRLDRPVGFLAIRSPGNPRAPPARA